jgi:thiol-disulfide isomerase/thioredoxin
MRWIASIFILTAAFAARADEHLPVLVTPDNVYSNVTVLKVTATDVVFTHNGALANAKLKDLSPELQKHFHYDAVEGGETEKAQIQADISFHKQLAQQPVVHPPDMTRYPEPNVPEGLEIGQKFPGFQENDIRGASLSVDNYRGKITLIDFWATWCGPCMGEMPNVVATYQKYHHAGFEIVGVSLDADRNALINVTQNSGMTWQEYFDGRGWQNKLSTRYQIESIPANFLLDRHGVIIAKDLRGESLGTTVEKALAAP